MDEGKIHLSNFPLPAKLFCTAFFVLLGIGVFVSEIKVLSKYRMADGRPWLTVRDLVLSFHGYPGAPLIEVKLRLAPTPDHREFQKKMYEEQVNYLIKWTKDGSSPKEEDFAPIVETLENHCVNCHDLEAAASSSPLWEDRVVKHELVAPMFNKTGAISATRLIHLTHIHLLTNVMMFVLTGAVVLFCRIGSRLKSALLVLPFIAIVLDMGSWWLTAFVSHLFAYTIMIGGTLVGVSFLLQFVFAIYGLWIQRASVESS